MDSQPPRARGLAPGSLIGKYTVLRLLAVGGSAEVYLVRSHGIEGFAKLAVLKRLLPHLVGHPDFAQMFLDEARLAANLHHPSIAQIFDFGRSGQSHFIAMEYVVGESLSNVIRSAAKKQRGFSLGNSLRVVQSVAAGLHYAHQLRGTDGTPLGIVHRDVSPHNVMLTFDGSVKLVDFGIATAQIGKRQSLPGSIKGNLRYMSPEQCAGEPVDRRSDLFSLGVLLFELTTGTRLHRETDDRDVVRRILHDPIPMPSTRRKEYPPELERIVMKALERDLSRRYATAQELQVDLELFARDRGVLPSNVALAEFMKEVFGEHAGEASEVPTRGTDDEDASEQGASLPETASLNARGSGRRIAVALLAGLAGLAGLSLYWAWLWLRMPSGNPNRAESPLASAGAAPPVPSAARVPVSHGNADPSARASLDVPTAGSSAASARTLDAGTVLAPIGRRTPSSAGSNTQTAARRPPQVRPKPEVAPAASANAGGMVSASSAAAAAPKASASWTLDSPLPP